MLLEMDRNMILVTRDVGDSTVVFEEAILSFEKLFGLFHSQVKMQPA